MLLFLYPKNPEVKVERMLQGPTTFSKIKQRISTRALCYLVVANAFQDVTVIIQMSHLIFFLRLGIFKYRYREE